MGKLMYLSATQFFIFPVVVYAILYPSFLLLPGVLLAFAMSMYGFSIGMHHTFTHPTFSFPRPVEKALAVFSTLSMLVPPIDWSASHIAHHRFVDTERDPHSKHNPQFRPSWKRYLLWFHSAPGARPLKRLVRDPFQRAIRKNYWFIILSHPLLAFAFGLDGLVYLYMLPLAYVQLTMLGLNTYTHDGPSNGRNTARGPSALMAVINLGDGDHRGHHEDASHVGATHFYFARIIGNENRTFSVSR
jgi:stearoyl-CoA desaturase (delta-9 desaturase)